MRQYQFNINIPRKAIKKYIGNKDLWDLFILNICLKLNSESSGIPDVTERKIRKLFHCGVEKSKRMLELAKQCEELFFYDPKTNYLASRKLTRGLLRKSTYTLRGKEYVAYSAYCLKFQFTVGKKIVHKEIARQVKDLLIQQMMMQKEREDDFLSVGHSTHPRPSYIITQTLLSKVAKMHRSTVSRHIKKLEESNQIKVIKSEPIPVLDHRTGECLTDNTSLLNRKLFYCPHLDCLVCQDPDRYKTIYYNIKAEWTNVIFNHKKRHSRNYNDKELALLCCTH